MLNKVMKIFYNENCFPFKDVERKVQYTILGNSFMGASNTTEVRFYVKDIGGIDNSWVCVSKLPNGKTGCKVMQTAHDSELNEDYAYLTLDNFYTQAKGDLYLTLCGYGNGIEMTYDSETQLYELAGTPTIQATGSVKINIAYATQVSGNDQVETITLQQILALVGDKLNKNSPNYIKKVSAIANINTATYEEYLQADDLVVDLATYKLYKISGTYPSLVATEISDLDDIGYTQLTTIANGQTFPNSRNLLKNVSFAHYNGQLFTRIESSGSTMLFANEWQVYDDGAYLSIGRVSFKVNPVTAIISNSGIETFEVYSKDDSDGKFVNLTGNQTISGKKTFTVLPQSSLNPSSENDFVIKKYVDAIQTALNQHKADHNNPHVVTKAQVGLGNVDNTSDINKPISTATQTALNQKANANDVYTKTASDNKFQVKLIAGAGIVISGNVITAIGGVSLQIVETLPETGIEGVIYLVPYTSQESNNYYTEYIWLDSNNAFEKIGTTQVDLTDYYTKSEMNGLLSLKQDKIDNDNKLPSDLVSDTNQTNKFVTNAEKTTWNNKLDKSSTALSLYATTSDGQTMIGYGMGTNGGKIPQRDSNGQINVPLTPINNEHATSKKYVDDLGATKQNALTTSSVSDGTLAKAIGFNSNGDLVKSDKVPYATHSDTATDLDAGSNEITQAVPFISQPSANASEVKTGNARLDEIRGNSVVYNQYVREVNATYWSRWSGSVSVSYNNGVATIEALETLAQSVSYKAGLNLSTGYDYSLKNGHIYLYYFEVKPSVNKEIRGELFSNSYDFSVSCSANTWNVVSGIKTMTTDTSKRYLVYPKQVDAVGETYQYRNMFMFDLTQWFGSNDAIPSDLLLDPSLWYKYDNTDDSYDTGSLLDSNADEIITIGRNIWDEEWELGAYNLNGAPFPSNNSIRSKTDHYIKVIPGVVYYFKSPQNIFVQCYDADKNFIKRDGFKNLTFTIPSNCCYIRFAVDSAYGTTYNHDITISLYYQNGTGYDQYYPYVKKVYPLGTQTLRSASSVYDVKLPDGKIKRNVGTYTFTGSESWTSYGSGYYCSAISSNVKKPANNNTVANILAPTLTTDTTNNIANGVVSSGIAVSNTGDIWISSSDYSNRATLLTGKTIYYKLATPTTEQGTSFAETIEIDNYGMMYFNHNGNLVPIPQANQITYGTNKGDFVDNVYNRVGGNANNIARVSDIPTFSPTSISVSNGGTITDVNTKALIQEHRPITLNGYTGYFTHDDGTNYHYFNIIYDSANSVNHLNVVTINKTTWEITFHTSNLALAV